jgi:hypothetical protein
MKPHPNRGPKPGGHARGGSLLRGRQDLQRRGAGGRARGPAHPGEEPKAENAALAVAIERFGSLGGGGRQRGERGGRVLRTWTRIEEGSRHRLDEVRLLPIGGADHDCRAVRVEHLGPKPHGEHRVRPAARRDRDPGDPAGLGQLGRQAVELVHLGRAVKRHRPTPASARSGVPARHGERGRRASLSSNPGRRTSRQCPGRRRSGARAPRDGCPEGS